MRLTVLALAMLPAAAQAQNTTTTIPSAPVNQSCPAGSAWDAGAAACIETAQSSKPHDAMGGGGCNYGAAREVTS